MSRRKGKEGRKGRKADAQGPAASAGPGLAVRLREGADRFFRDRFAPPAALAVLVFAIYARSVDDPLIYWDDNLYILEDVRVQELSLGNAWRIATQPYAANFHPLTTFTFAVDRAMWGDGLRGFHVTQLAFYAAGIVLLFYVFRAVLKSPGAAFAGAAIYAAHAIHVESVAWLASRKDVVCLVFYAAAVLAYFRYAREDKKPWRYYALFAALAAAAMLSKGYAAVLPAVLLVYDWCLARKLGLRQVLDKLPLFALGALLTVFMIAAQEKDAAPLGEIATGHRLVAQCKIYAVYAARTILPVDLSIDYRQSSRIDWLGPGVAVLGAVLFASTVAAFFVLRKRLPAAAWGVAILLGQLATVMSTFFTLRQWMTDRYLFFPTVGWTLAVTAGGLWFCRNWRQTPGTHPSSREPALPRQGSSGGRRSRPGCLSPIPAAVRRAVVPVAATGLILLYAALSVVRLGAWQSELHIWSDAVRKQQGMPGSGPLALRELQGQTFSDLGALLRVVEAFKREGRYKEAKAIRDAVGRVPPDLARGHEIQLARHDIEAGRYDEAIRRLTPVAERGKFSARRAWVWLGEAQRLKGETDKAREAYLKSLEMSGEGGRAAATVMVEVGNLDFAAGRFKEAAEWYERAREDIGPTNPRAQFYLGLTCERMGKLEEAYELCEGTLRLEGKVPPNVPFNYADVYLELGVIAKKLGRKEEAAKRYEEALARSPNHPRAAAVRREIKALRRGPPGR